MAHTNINTQIHIILCILQVAMQQDMNYCDQMDLNEDKKGEALAGAPVPKPWRRPAHLERVRLG